MSELPDEPKEKERPKKLVGVCGTQLNAAVSPKSSVREVYVVEDVIEHYKEHKGQFDIEKAEGMLADAIADPLFVYQDKAEKTLDFIIEYDEDYYLLIPVKCLPNELWLSTMFIQKKTRFHKKDWVQAGPLYSRQSGEENEQEKREE